MFGKDRNSNFTEIPKNPRKNKVSKKINSLRNTLCLANFNQNWIGKNNPKWPDTELTSTNLPSGVRKDNVPETGGHRTNDQNQARMKNKLTFDLRALQEAKNVALRFD